MTEIRKNKFDKYHQVGEKLETNYLLENKDEMIFSNFAEEILKKKNTSVAQSVAPVVFHGNEIFIKQEGNWVKFSINLKIKMIDYLSAIIKHKNYNY